MTNSEYLTDEQSRERDIANLLLSTFAEPNHKTFHFVDGTLYAVIRMAWCEDVHDDRPVVRWIGVFPAKGPQTGISWRNFFCGDEQQARAELAYIDQESADYFYKEMREGYERPPNW